MRDRFSMTCILTTERASDTVAVGFSPLAQQPTARCGESNLPTGPISDKLNKDESGGKNA